MDTWQTTLQNAQNSLAANDPVIAKLAVQYGNCTIQPHDNYYGELVSAIIGQQLSEKAGATIYKRFLTLFDDKLPTPEQIIAVDAEAVRGIGCSYNKVGYMKDLAQHIVDGRLDLDHIASLPDDQVVHQLTAVKGIGEWSAHMFMMFSLGRLNILPTGDLGVRKGMMIQYGLSELPKPAAMNQLALKNSWPPYQSVASWYMWQSLENQ